MIIRAMTCHERFLWFVLCDYNNGVILCKKTVTFYDRNLRQMLRFYNVEKFVKKKASK